MTYFQHYVKQVRSNNEAAVLALQLSEKTKHGKRKYETYQFFTQKHLERCKKRKNRKVIKITFTFTYYLLLTLTYFCQLIKFRNNLMTRFCDSFVFFRFWAEYFSLKIQIIIFTQFLMPDTRYNTEKPNEEI